MGGEKAGRCVGCNKSTMAGKYTCLVTPLARKGALLTIAISLTSYCTRYHSGMLEHAQLVYIQLFFSNSLMEGFRPMLDEIFRSPSHLLGLSNVLPAAIIGR